MKGLINVGITPQTVKEARSAINDIMRATAGDSVKQAALGTLATICNVTNTTISHNTLTGGK